MTLVDLNLTYGQNYCNMATGAIIGGIGILYLLGRLLLFGLLYYVVYRVTKIFMERYNYKNKEKFKKKDGNKTNN